MLGCYDFMLVFMFVGFDVFSCGGSVHFIVWIE